MHTSRIPAHFLPAALRFAHAGRTLHQHAESILALACGALLALALWGPVVTLPAHYHDFADQRGWPWLPHAMDVLSNLAFAVAGLLGMVRVRKAGGEGARLWSVQRQMVVLFLVGLVLTAVGSGWYHWRPDDAGLKLDRLGMVVAFAGLLGLLTAGRVSERAARVMALLVLVAGSVSAWTAQAHLNQTPWVVVQFGGTAIMVFMARLRARDGALPVRWMVVVLIYVLAKALEQGDQVVFAWTGQLVSGHSLKHLIAGCAAWPVIAALPRAHHHRHFLECPEQGQVTDGVCPG